MELSFEARLEAKDTRRSIERFRAALRLVTGGRRGDGLTAVSKTFVCKATLDAKTYEPLEVFRSDRVVLHETVDGKTTQTPVQETHRYVFER